MRIIPGPSMGPLAGNQMRLIIIREAVILETQFILLTNLISIVYLFIYFLVFFFPPKEDVSIIDAVSLMDPVVIDNNDSDAFCWTKIIKSPRVLIICVTGF